MDCSPPGSSVHGILQARILEWVAISFSRVFSWLGIEPGSPELQADSLSNELQGKPQEMKSKVNFKGEDYTCGFWNQAQRRKTRWGWKWWQTLVSLSLMSHRLETLGKHRVPALWLDCEKGGSLTVWKFHSTPHTQNWSTRLLCPGIWAWTHSSGCLLLRDRPLGSSPPVVAENAAPLWAFSSPCNSASRIAILPAGSLSAHSPSLSSSGLWFLSTP